MHSAHRFSSRAIFALALAVLGAGSGCGAGRDAADKHLHKLQDELTRLQGTADRLEDRVAALELRGEAPKRPEAAQESATAVIYRPRLKVIHMGPGNSQGSTEDANGGADDKPESKPQER
jgi:hypothetical protein